MKTVLIIDNDINYLETAKEYFDQSSKFRIVTCSSKVEALKKITEGEFSAIVLNLVMNGLDSIEILSKLRKDTVVITTAEFLIPSVLGIIQEYKPDGFIKKPYSFDALEKTLTSINKRNETDPSIDMKIRITDMLHKLGVPSHLKGFGYVRDCIEYVYNDYTLINAITKKLYPKVADKNNATVQGIEKAIRNAIETSWMRGDYDFMDEVFGNSVDFDRAKPTNSEFIGTLADRLKLQNSML